MHNMKFRCIDKEHQNEIMDNLFRIGYLRPIGFGQEKFNHFTPFLFTQDGIIKWSKDEEVFSHHKYHEATLEELKNMKA